MSDSDNDLMPNNVISFQNYNTTFCARGPNINTTNLTSLSFRNNVMTSTMHMPRNFDRQRYIEPSYDQRSMYYRRDTSPPMSLNSCSDFRPKNYQQMYYPRGMSSQTSMINGRGGSPMSVRSIDSNATVSAADIAMAFKNMNFNKYDLKVIKDAYNKFMKRRIRKKIEKRRNLRLFMKGQCRKSGYDSGELGSDSSISSDDCRSTSTAFYKDNMSSCRSTKTDLTDFRRTMKESILYKDCTDNFRQNSTKNMFSVAPGNISMLSQTKAQNTLSVSQRDRFKTGYVLPSQRFNQSIASVPIPEKRNILHNNYIPKHRSSINRNPARAHRNEIDSEPEEIFSEMTHKEKSIGPAKFQSGKPIVERKRSLDYDDHRFHDNKRSKLSSPKKNEIPLQNETVTASPKDKNKFNEFVKPQLPVRKSRHIQEKLLAKSAPPIDIVTPALPNITKNQEKSAQAQDHNENNDQTCSNEQLLVMEQSTSEVTMRPSFIKRKLYTQKLDLMESKNLSSDNLGANSPQTNIYSAIQKEKNKTRKLVANQSCLSRDVQQEDNNLLDLIHKIVPPDLMNVTNKSEVVNNNSNSKNKPADDEKWDVTSVISKCNFDDVSDTYTDEEIFNVDDKKSKTKNTLKPQEPTIACKVIVKKLPLSKEIQPQKNQPNTSIAKQDTKKGNVYKCVKSFWDIDSESDLETNATKHCKSDQKENHYPGTYNKNTSLNQVKSNLDVNNSKMSSTKVKSKLLKTNNIMDQVKKLNVSLSLMKKTKTDEKRLESSQFKEAKQYNADKDRELIGKVAAHKKIVLDSHNSNNTFSDVTQNETIKKNNNKKMRAKPITKSDAADDQKNMNLSNSKLIPDTKTETNKKISTNKATSNNNTNVKGHKGNTAKGNTNTSIIKRVSPRKTKETVQKSSKPQAKQTTRENTIGLDDLKSKKNIKPQPKKVNIHDSIAKRKSPRTPKEFKCCNNTSQPKDKKKSKTSTRSTPLKPKKPISSMKMFLDNNNSSFSDGTPTRILRSMKN